jgi:hypothetical protein
MPEPSETGWANTSGKEHRALFFTHLFGFLRCIGGAFRPSGSRRILRQYHRRDRRAHLDAELDDPDFDR